jgi:outer membrane protein
MGIRSTWFSGPHHRFVAMLDFTVFDDSIKDSPIIDTDHASSMILGYASVFYASFEPDVPVTKSQ